MLFDLNGNTVSEVVVRIITINDSGTETAQVDAVTTNTDGRFSISNSFFTANGTLLAVASLPSGTLRGFVAGRESVIPIHPLTEGLVSLILDITRTSGDPTLLDFSNTELRNIADSLFRLNTAGIDLTDANRVEDFIRSGVGRQIALAGGGAISGESTSAFDAAELTTTANFAANTAICSIGVSIFSLMSSTIRFGIEQDGSLCGATNSTLDDMLSEGAFQLRLPDEQFNFFGGTTFTTGNTGTGGLESEREVVLGPSALEKPSTDEEPVPEADDLTVTRKVFVPTSGDFVRFLEIFSNSGSTARQLTTVQLRSFLETGNESALLTFDSAATNNQPTTSDRFVVAVDNDGNRPTVGFIFQDGLTATSLSQLNFPGGATGEANEVTAIWSNITVPANGTRTMLSYGLVSSSRSANELTSAILAIIDNPDMTRMSISELVNLINMTPSSGTITGTPSAVGGEVDVTATNERSGSSITVSARSDGSFAIPLDTQSGDRVRVTATDGLDTTITIP